VALMLLMSLILALPLLAGGPPSDEDEDSSENGSIDFVEYVEVKDSSLPSSNTIATKLAVPLQRTPANVGVVGQPLIYEQSAFVLGDTLRNVSGVNIQNGSGVSEFFSIRGFDSISSVLVMTDGAAEPEVSFYQMYNVRGVEVFKGPAGFLYGKNPLAGAVNIVRKQPLPSNFTVFSGSYGSFDSSLATVDWNLSPGDDTVSFRLNGVWQESDRFRDDKESRHIAVNPSLTWNIGEKSTLNFNLEHVDAEYTPDSGLPLVGNAVPDVRRENSYDQQTDFSEQTLDRFQIDFETRINDRVTFRNKAYYRDLDWRTDGTVLLGENPFLPPGAPPLIVRSSLALDDQQEFLGNQAELIVELAHGAVEHKLLAGVEIARQEDRYTFGITPADSITLDQVAAPPFPFPPQSSAGDVRSTVTSPYLIDQIKFGDRFEVLVGARYDFIDFEGDVMSIFGAPQTVSRRDSELSPMAGVLYAPLPSLSLYANAARSHAPPSSRLAQVEDVESLEPEQGTQYEVGLKKLFADGKIRTTLAVYSLERENIALADMTFGFTQQSGDQRSRGAEIELAAEFLPGLRTFFSYAYNDAELTDYVPFVTDPFTGVGAFQDFTGNTPIMAPEHLANLWISKSFDNGFGVSGGARFVDEQFVGEDNAFTLESSIVLDAAAFYDMKAWRFKLNLKNFTDEEYEMRGIAGASSVIPADPFAVYASIEFRM
jgi:TonB-dependent siderophore receptor